MQGPSLAADQLAALRAVFGEAGCTDTTTTYIIGTFDVENLADFVNMVPEKTYAESWAAKMEPKRSGEECLPKFEQQLARVRGAWKLAKAKLEQSSSPSSNLPHAEIDMESPLPEGIAAELQKRWSTLYPHVDWEAEITAADSLVARLYREFMRKSAQVHAVEKCKNQLSAQKPSEMRRVPVGEAMLTLGVDEHENISSCVEYYWGLRTLAGGMSFAGSHEVEPQGGGDKIIFSPLGINIRYADSALRKASKWRLPAAQAVQELRDRDVVTRSTMCTYMRGGWSQGEALRQALIEHRVDWQTAPVATFHRADPHQDGPAHKKPKKEGGAPSARTHKGKEICKAFNDQRGCKNNKCPRVHVCDAPNRSGQTCGQTNHSRMQHR